MRHCTCVCVFVCVCVCVCVCVQGMTADLGGTELDAFIAQVCDTHTHAHSNACMSGSMHLQAF